MTQRRRRIAEGSRGRFFSDRFTCPVSLARRIRSSQLAAPAAQLQVRELTAAGVCAERCDPHRVDVLEPQQCTGVGPFATNDDAHPGRPTGQVRQVGELGDPGAVTELVGRIVGRDPDMLGHESSWSGVFSALTLERASALARSIAGKTLYTSAASRVIVRDTVGSEVRCRRVRGDRPESRRWAATASSPRSTRSPGRPPRPGRSAAPRRPDRPPPRLSGRRWSTGGTRQSSSPWQSSSP